MDLFIDEDLAYALRLIRLGVPTELHVYHGAVHRLQFDRPVEATLKAIADGLAVR